MGTWHRASSLWGQRASHPASLIKRIKEQVNNRPAEAEDGDGVAERAAAEDEGEGERDAARGAVAGAGGGAGGDVDGVGGIAAEAVGIVNEQAAAEPERNPGAGGGFEQPAHGPIERGEAGRPVDMEGVERGFNFRKD